MKVNLHFENVGIGDCLLLNLRDNGQEFTMLIDCGKYNSKIKELFEKTYKITKLDKLVITHFDDDHIKGVIELLKDRPELKIEDIWFNCFRHLPKDKEIELT
ncbi:MAG: MBL fold metallo-hydrolase, partial [Paludibacter sp.]